MDEMSKHEAVVEKLRSKFSDIVDTAIAYYEKMNPKCDYYPYADEEDDAER